MAKLLLLDGFSLAFRAFYALPADMATPNGTVTNAAYGFTSMLLKVLSDERPDYVGAIFDAPGGTFRDELDSQYKATRGETPELFSSQVPLIFEVLTTLGFRVIQVPGVEADDVIATLAAKGAAAGIDVSIVTGDRDSFQLVCDPHVEVIYNRRGVSDYVRYDEAGIFERTGVTPAQYVDYAAMRGDPSDNLPGVPGIGEKSAASLMSRFGSIAGIYEHVDELPPKQRANLIDHRDRVLLNLEMMKLRCDLDVAADPEDLSRGSWSESEIRSLFGTLAFRGLVDRALALGGGLPEVAQGESNIAPHLAPEATLQEVSNLLDPASAIAWIRAICIDESPIGIDLHWRAEPRRGTCAQSDIVGMGLAGDALTGVVAGFISAPVLFDHQVQAELGNLFRSCKRRIAGHGTKRLCSQFEWCTQESLKWDTEVMAYLLDPGASAFAVAALALEFLSLDLNPSAVATGRLDFDGTDAAVESGHRAEAVRRLGAVLETRLAEREELSLFESTERPLIGVLARMEDLGVAVDLEYLLALGAEIHVEIAALEQKIHDLAGGPFNVNSTPQLRTVLFETLGLTPVKKTKTGPSTDADSLRKLANAHPIVAELLRYRELEKLRSTYADALPPLVESDGRIHGTLNQCSTATGRISSERPNLQNIPIRTDEGRALRRSFVAASGSVLVVADYSQIELRVLAHLADDPGLIEAFANGEDVHAVTAARIFGVPVTKVDAKQRRMAKVVNFGLAYGMEAYGLATRLEIEPGEAKSILENYFNSFPNVHAFMERTILEARSRGYTTTLFGRRRALPELQSSNFQIRQMAERMAQNAPVQGTAADLFKIAMVNLDFALKEQRLSAYPVLTVHDELVIETPTSQVDDVVALTREVMEGVHVLAVSLVVDVGVGENWAEAKPS